AQPGRPDPRLPHAQDRRLRRPRRGEGPHHHLTHTLHIEAPPHRGGASARSSHSVDGPVGWCRMALARRCGTGQGQDIRYGVLGRGVTTMTAGTGSAAAREQRAEIDQLAEATLAALHAPSILNTQPWRWRTRGNDVELRVDADRRLAGVAPTGRLQLMSCGAALNHAL